MPDISENKKRYLALLKKEVHRPGINKLINYLNESDFFTAPCSTKFHLACPGGLCEHSLNVFDKLYELVTHDPIYSVDISMESMVIVSLLHDLCKCNTYEAHTNVDGSTNYIFKEEKHYGDHADKSIIIILKHMQLTDDEIYAIRGHMGGFDNAARGGSKMLSGIYSNSPLAVYLQCADMISCYISEKGK